MPSIGELSIELQLAFAAENTIILILNKYIVFPNVILSSRFTVTLCIYAKCCHQMAPTPLFTNKNPVAPFEVVRWKTMQ